MLKAQCITLSSIKESRRCAERANSSNNNNAFEDTTGALSFIPPTINPTPLLQGQSYTVYSPCPQAIQPINPTAITTDDTNKPTECVLGVDEAGRGPVLGPMVYSAFYLPKDLEQSLLTQEHSFDDSKVLTPVVRAQLMQSICTPGQSLHDSCGWAVKLLSARDISAGMMRPGMGIYNLNAQAMDATVEIIRGVLNDKHINVTEIYIDTIGNPATYQAKLQRLFPTLSITVAKKADSLYPCVSAASVVAKVTRDVALESCYRAFYQEPSQKTVDGDTNMMESSETIPPSVSKVEELGWGSGYPSDSKCVNWLRQNMDSVFGWGNECRFSWGTAKEMLDGKDAVRVDWPADEDEGAGLADFLSGNHVSGTTGKADDVGNWYGTRVTAF
ncbi:ribonuclease HI large subunit [Talaromyces stipitatus ATCC 10500]|uniref:Ribonuclease n=1 Tax=Talaromyces stipitatus (strain ATCC 10500 / CBS 375.48 / QM 6759 / NRRL 1006) TaxID=441959 RepID=B8MIG9_TALSN|nr:ribonuclease HI large subunit [Talaromyces stipitatus ATCC 10500]EED15059.1 ribonuclease HI large subunit [Talaromyces stipitatus ATCC 10500]